MKPSQSLPEDRPSPLDWDALVRAFSHLPKDASHAKIEQTARELELHTFSPTLLIDMPDLIRAGRHQVSAHATHVMNLPDDAVELALPLFPGDPQQVKLMHLRLLLDQYTLITQLRKGIPEAWDRINELYEDD